MKLDAHLEALLDSADTHRGEGEDCVTFTALIETAIRLNDSSLDFRRLIDSYLDATGNVETITNAVYLHELQRFTKTHETTLGELWGQRHRYVPHSIEIAGRDYNGSTLAPTGQLHFSIHTMTPGRAKEGESLVMGEQQTFAGDTPVTVKERPTGTR